MGERTQLPEGYELDQDQDGDWLLIGPPDVVLFSEPGEPILLAGFDQEAALAEALELLAKASPHV